MTSKIEAIHYISTEVLKDKYDKFFYSWSCGNILYLMLSVYFSL